MRRKVLAILAGLIILVAGSVAISKFDLTPLAELIAVVGVAALLLAALTAIWGDDLVPKKVVLIAAVVGAPLLILA